MSVKSIFKSKYLTLSCSQLFPLKLSQDLKLIQFKQQLKLEGINGFEVKLNDKQMLFVAVL